MLFQVLPQYCLEFERNKFLAKKPLLITLFNKRINQQKYYRFNMNPVDVISLRKKIFKMRQGAVIIAKCIIYNFKLCKDGIHRTI